MNKKKFFLSLIFVIVVVALVAALFACSPRAQGDPNDSIVQGDVDTTPKEIVKKEKFSKTDGSEAVKKHLLTPIYFIQKL